MAITKSQFLILDANILIDFLKCDRTIIKLISTNVGQVYLATPVLDEISEINDIDCAELGIILVEPELDQVMTAAEKKDHYHFKTTYV
ncbi:hypothetical protein [Desulfosporosinus sp. HMP52]|uniref:hypothetical protein n=1 Tax=Desulfosporosinus sp. HMP52 TaxID=1487923 RepID=UPI000A483B3D|nr:hypothetical protein [Desulfosporosinus sp. HMP52]